MKYFNKKNIFNRPWGKYINLYSGKGFLVKDPLMIKRQIMFVEKEELFLN